MAFWENITNSLKARKGEFTGTSGKNNEKINKKIDENKSVNISNPTSQRTFHRDNNGSLLDQQIDVGDTSGQNQNVEVGDIVSSAIQNVDYDPNSQVASVTFQGGNQSYDYKVSPDEMKEFINAPSKGQWINYIWKFNNRMPGY